MTEILTKSALRTSHRMRNSDPLNPIVRLPQALFAGGGYLINDGPRLDAEKVVSLQLGRFKLNWHFTRGLGPRHIRILIALLSNFQEATEKGDYFVLDPGTQPDARLQKMADDDVALWDQMQNKTAIWKGSGSRLLWIAGMDANDSCNRLALSELLFAENGLDIKVSLLGGHIKKCRPVSIFKSVIKNNSELIVKLNWFFAQTMFNEFKDLPGGGSSVLKYTRIELDLFQMGKSHPRLQSTVLWLSFLTNSFLSPIDLRWEKLEGYIYGQQKRSRRQIRDNISYLRKCVFNILVNFSVNIDSDLINSAVSGENLRLPVLRLKKQPPLVTATNEGLPGFDEFWQIWPATQRKNSRTMCQIEWRNQNLEVIADEIVAAVRRRKQSTDWIVKKDERVPAPINYLRRREWES